MKVLFVFLFLPFNVNAQNNFTGTVINQKNLARVPYATVALMKENTGVNADENGIFTLTSFNTRPNDTLVISSVGYESLKIPINSLPSSKEYQLQEKLNLPDILVTGNKKWNTVELNHFGNCGTDYLSAQDYTSQIGQYFHSDTSDYLLTEVEICKYAIAIIDPDKSIFRVRIYAVDSATDGPSYDITDSIIEVKSPERRVKINLEKYNIYITSHDFFVAIEWLKIPYNASKEKTKINGKRIFYTDYGPSICHERGSRNNPYEPISLPGVWHKNYKGVWSPMAGVSRLMIATKIKY